MPPLAVHGVLLMSLTPNHPLLHLLQDLELTIKSNMLRLQVAGTTQDITLPTVVRDTDYTAKFLKKKRVLKLAFEKLQ